MSRVFTLLALTFLLSSCVSELGKYTVLSNKLVDLQALDISNESKIKTIQGKDTKRTFFMIIPVNHKANIDTALEKVLERYDRDLMTDVSIRKSDFVIPFLYSQTKYIVEGDLVKTRK